MKIESQPMVFDEGRKTERRSLSSRVNHSAIDGRSLVEQYENEMISTDLFASK